VRPAPPDLARALAAPAGSPRTTCVGCASAWRAGGPAALTPDMPIEPGEVWYAVCGTCLGERPYRPGELDEGVRRRIVRALARGAQARARRRVPADAGARPRRPPPGRRPPAGARRPPRSGRPPAAGCPRRPGTGAGRPRPRAPPGPSPRPRRRPGRSAARRRSRRGTRRGRWARPGRRGTAAPRGGPAPGRAAAAGTRRGGAAPAGPPSPSSSRNAGARDADGGAGRRPPAGAAPPAVATGGSPSLPDPAPPWHASCVLDRTVESGDGAGSVAGARCSLRRDAGPSGARRTAAGRGYEPTGAGARGYTKERHAWTGRCRP
jgi:hypothetical protein